MANPVALKDPKAGADTAMGAGIQTLSIVPQSIGEVVMFADRMAESRFVPPHLRGKPGDCFAVALQAFRWRMDPFSVASKSYFVNDRMAYEAQLINAVVLAHAPLRERPKIMWAGAWPSRTCTVSGVFLGETEPKIRTVSAATIKVRNSPLWISDPDQQLGYVATRAWARLYCPDILLGVYSDDEDTRAERATDVTPASAEPPVRPASRLDAMEAAIAGETAPASHEAPTFEQDFGFPADGGELGPKQPELGVMQPGAPQPPTLQPDTDAYDKAETQARAYITKILAATDADAITASLRKNQATIEAWPLDIKTVVYEQAASRKKALGA